VTADGGKLLRRASTQTAKPHLSTAQVADPAEAAPLPDWARRPAPPEPLMRMPLAPSRLAPVEREGTDASSPRKRGHAAEPPMLSPSALAEDGRFLRGTLTHALLEHLPPLPADRRQAAADAFIASRGPQLPAEVRRSIVAETLAILRDAAFAPLFSPQSRAEVPIVADIGDPQGAGPALRVTGKIDRLVQDGKSILIVDYKTNRPPPKREAEVADAYLLQLAAYRLAIARIFPGAHIRAAILWTDGPRIMEISPIVLDAAQHRLWQREGSQP
jgi:ATP-dependent helicase/nuclease subunit A